MQLSLLTSLSLSLPSAPCSQAPSVHVPPLMAEIKFYTYTEPQATLQFYIYYFYDFGQQTIRQKVKDYIVANIMQIQSPLNHLSKLYFDVLL
jgi:hypothetical protein